MSIPTREEAWALLCEYTESDNLRKHALSVEAAMRHYARRFNEDEELWGVTGLLHDFDYERYPSLEDHPFRGSEILKARGYDDVLVQAILAHAPHTGVTRETPLQKTIFAVDELCGFVTAVTLVRPSKQVADVSVKSVKKKIKDKAFARGVNRDDIRLGAAELGIELDRHIGEILEAMRGSSDELGL